MLVEDEARGGEVMDVSSRVVPGFGMDDRKAMSGSRS